MFVPQTAGASQRISLLQQRIASLSSYETSSEGYYSSDEEDFVDEDVPKSELLADAEKDKNGLHLGTISLPVKAAPGFTIESLKSRLVSNGILYRPCWGLRQLCLDSLFNVSSTSQRPKFLTFDVPEAEQPAIDAADDTYIVNVDLLAPGLRGLNVLVELPKVCTPAVARAKITEQLQEQLSSEPRALVLLWAHASLDTSALRLEPVAEEEEIEAQAIECNGANYKHKRLVVCWLPKAPDPKGKKAANQAEQQFQPQYCKQYVLVQHISNGHPVSRYLLMPFKDSCLPGGKKPHAEMAEALKQLLYKHCKTRWGFYSSINPPSTPDIHLVRECPVPGDLRPRPTSSPASFHSSRGALPLTWLCPDVIAHLYFDAQYNLGIYFDIHPASLDNHPRQMLLSDMQDEQEHQLYQRRRQRQRLKLLQRLPLYDAVSELRTAAQRVHPNHNYGAASKPVIAVKLELNCPDAAKSTKGVATFKVFTWQSATATHGSLLSSPTSLSTAANTLRDSGLLLGWFGDDDIIGDISDSGSDSEDEYNRPWRFGWNGMMMPQRQPNSNAAGDGGGGGGAAAGGSGDAAAAGSSAAAATAAAAGSSADAAAAAAAERLAEADRLRRLYRCGSKTALPLRMTLRLMCAESAEVSGMYQSWMESMDAWGRAEKSVKGLLDMLRTGPGPAAPQPEGLAVQLRPHQLQTLSRLLARERDPLGFNSLMWTKFEREGRSWWLSLVLSKLSLVAPPKTVTGGLLAEEMGLGKTVEVLALILAHPAPEVHTTTNQQQHQQQQQRSQAGSSRAAAAAAAAAGPSSRQSKKQQQQQDGAVEHIITRPGERLPGQDGAAGSKHSRSSSSAAAAAAAAAGTACRGKAAASKAKGKAKKGKTQGKRKRDECSSDEDDEAATDSDAEQADGTAAAGGGRGRGRGRGSRGGGRAGGRAGGRGSSALWAGAARTAVESLLAGNASGAYDAIAAMAAEEGEKMEAEAAAALPSTERPGLLYSRATLVVCAVSLVGQWIDEAEDKTQGSLRMFKYHGPNRSSVALQQLAADYDVVVTTYQTLVADRSQHEQPPLEQIQWWRVVFDEGHVLKTVSSATTKAAVALAAPNRWVVTGTPIGGAVADLAGQFAALQLWPFNVPSYFQENVKHPLGRQYINNPSSRLFSPLPVVHMLRHLVTRHTKDQELEGQAVLQLPPKTVTNVPVVLNVEEATAYKEVYGRARTIWLTLAAAGPSAINRHILAAMSLVLPLRRICSGGRLTSSDMQVREIDLSATAHLPTSPAALAAAAAATSSLLSAGLPCAGVAAPDDEECVVCLDCLEVPVVTPCGHWFCKECIMSCLHSNNTCPLCRAPIAQKDLKAGLNPAAEEQQAAEEEWAAAAAAGGGVRQVVVCDSKLKVLLKELAAMRAADPSSKALVFTQYNSTLEWLKKALPAAGFGYRSISGSMPLNQRTKAIEMFQRDPPTTVFLLSVRSGAVGINLTAASHVFLLEPCLNPALEEQAIGRAWRMGQRREVIVKRLYVKGSVEEKIMQLAEARRSGAHIPGTSRWADTAAAAPAAAGPSRAGAGSSAAAAAAAAAQQLAGALKADTQKLRAAELEGLFAAPTLPPPAPLPPAPAAAAAAAANGAAEIDSGDAAATATTTAAAAAADDDGAGPSSSAAAAAATAAAAGFDAADLELERQLAAAGLLAGSSRAAAWAGYVFDDGAGNVQVVSNRPQRRAAMQRRHMYDDESWEEDTCRRRQPQQQQQRRQRRNELRQQGQQEDDQVEARAAGELQGGRTAAAAAAVSDRQLNGQQQRQPAHHVSPPIVIGSSSDDDSSSSEEVGHNSDDDSSSSDDDSSSSDDDSSSSGGEQGAAGGRRLQRPPQLEDSSDDESSSSDESSSDEEGRVDMRQLGWYMFAATAAALGMGPQPVWPAGAAAPAGGSDSSSDDSSDSDSETSEDSSDESDVQPAEQQQQRGGSSSSRGRGSRGGGGRAAQRGGGRGGGRRGGASLALSAGGRAAAAANGPGRRRGRDGNGASSGQRQAKRGRRDG